MADFSVSLHEDDSFNLDHDNRKYLSKNIDQREYQKIFRMQETFRSVNFTSRLSKHLMKNTERKKRKKEEKHSLQIGLKNIMIP